MLGDVNKLFVLPSNVLPLYLKQSFLPIIWIFTEGEGDGIETMLPFKIFSTLPFLRSMLLKVGLSSLFSALCYATPLALCIAGVCSSRSGVHSLSLCRSLKNSVPSLRGHWPKEVRNTWLSIVVLGLVSYYVLCSTLGAAFSVIYIYERVTLYRL